MIKCVAIDDEPIALDIIREYCRRYGNVKLECFSSPIEGLDYVRRTNPDILFLDIELNSHNGIQLARQVPHDVCIIFTTAYSQYALDGFDLDAVDFLHKPIFFPRFVRAMEKARKMMPVKTEASDSITLKVEHKNVVIELDDILYVEAMDNYVKVYRKNNPTVVSQITMKEVEGILPDDRFCRVHRSFIIALAQVDKFTNREIYFRNIDRVIPVGRKYLENFKNQYN